jgi:hypothetical protein
MSREPADRNVCATGQRFMGSFFVINRKSKSGQAWDPFFVHGRFANSIRLKKQLFHRIFVR